MKSKILVVKYGSSSVSSAKGLDSAKISEYASKIKDLSNDYRIAIVSSGSVAAGRAIIGEMAGRPRR
jgi:glutamate 5-kinase